MIYLHLEVPLICYPSFLIYDNWYDSVFFHHLTFFSWQLMPIFHFNIPAKNEKTRGFLIFSKGRDLKRVKHWILIRRRMVFCQVFIFFNISQNPPLPEASASAVSLSMWTHFSSGKFILSLPSLETSTSLF